MNYEKLVKRLRLCGEGFKCRECDYINVSLCRRKMNNEAADAIEKLLHAAKKMHTWIFLHSYDEQKAYDECGLSDEMNAALGYSGQFKFRAEPPKEETE